MEPPRPISWYESGEGREEGRVSRGECREEEEEERKVRGKEIRGERVNM